jgi:hypothetical protein
MTTTLESTSPASVVLLPAKEGGFPFGGFDEVYIEALRKGKLRKALVSPEIAVPPQAGDELEADGSVWKFAACTPLAPAGIIVLYLGLVEAVKPISA